MTELPLSARVHAPVELQPASVAGVVWRSACLDDLDIVVTLYAAIAKVDHSDWTETREEVEQEFTRSWTDLDHDTLIGASDGVPVAFGQVICPPDPESIVRSLLYGGVHPDYRGRGIGRALLDWQEGRARQQLAASELRLPGWILCYSGESNTGASILYDRAGFTAQRYFWQLERELGQPIPDLDLVAPLRMVALSSELSEATRLAKNEAFRDHWGSQPISSEQWEGMMALPERRFDLSFLALEGERVVGFVVVDMSGVDIAGEAGTSGFRAVEIVWVGVLADWRRRGVAQALLAESLRASHQAGIQRAALNVDSDSPTGAIGLYAGMGFARKSSSRANVKAF
jgi:mycothiol synthase